MRVPVKVLVLALVVVVVELLVSVVLLVVHPRAQHPAILSATKTTQHLQV